MRSEAHNWQQVAEKLRQAMGLCPPTPADADEAILQAGEIPMSEEEIQSIVRNVTGGHVPPPSFHPDVPWAEDMNTESFAEDSRLVMHRNAGDEDTEVDREIDKLREEGLEDEDDEDDQAGLAGG